MHNNKKSFHDMDQVLRIVRRIEKSIYSEVADKVNKRLKHLTDETTLEIGEIKIKVMEIDKKGDLKKRWIVSDVRITCRFPETDKGMESVC